MDSALFIVAIGTKGYEMHACRFAPFHSFTVAVWMFSFTFCHTSHSNQLIRNSIRAIFNISCFSFTATQKINKRRNAMFITFCHLETNFIELNAIKIDLISHETLTDSPYKV